MLRWVGIACLLGAAYFGGYVAWLLWGTGIQTQQAQDRLRPTTQHWAAHPEPVPTTPGSGPQIIPGDAYAGHHAPIRTIGVDSLLLCRAEIDPLRVYEITRTWFLAVQSSTDATMSGVVGPSRASATPIPLHTGAARYYRERQLQP